MEITRAGAEVKARRWWSRALNSLSWSAHDLGPSASHTPKFHPCTSLSQSREVELTLLSLGVCFPAYFADRRLAARR